MCVYVYTHIHIYRYIDFKALLIDSSRSRDECRVWTDNRADFLNHRALFMDCRAVLTEISRRKDSCKVLTDDKAVLAECTGWRRQIGCLRLQVIFRQSAANLRPLLRKMTHNDQASCGSLPTFSANLTGISRFRREQTRLFWWKVAGGEMQTRGLTDDKAVLVDCGSVWTESSRIKRESRH